MHSTRTLTKLTLEVQEDRNGYLVQVTSRYCESNIAGGKIVHDVARYEALSIAECRQLIEDISYQAMPGAPAEEQHSLFTLS